MNKILNKKRKKSRTLEWNVIKMLKDWEIRAWVYLKTSKLSFLLSGRIEVCTYFTCSLSMPCLPFCILSGPGNSKISFCTTLPSGSWLGSVKRRNLQKISRQKEQKCFVLLALGMKQVVVVSGSSRWRGNRVEVFQVQHSGDKSFQPPRPSQAVHLSRSSIYWTIMPNSVLDFQLSTLGH